jgi:hypothetical protein
LIEYWICLLILRKNGSEKKDWVHITWGREKEKF